MTAKATALVLLLIGATTTAAWIGSNVNRMMSPLLEASAQINAQEQQQRHPHR